MNLILESVKQQIQDALRYLPGGCIYAVLITVCIFIGMLLWKLVLHKNISLFCRLKLIPLFLVVSYLYCVLQLTILSRTQGNFGGIDMRFLARWNESNEQKAFLIANIIMFIPLGVLLPMFGKWVRHILVSFPLAVVISIAIEAIQLKYQIGFCQLDDVVANSTGFLVGYLIFLVLYDIFQIIAFFYYIVTDRGNRNHTRNLHY